jgi:hypothetical protein
MLRRPKHSKIEVVAPEEEEKKNEKCITKMLYRKSTYFVLNNFFPENHTFYEIMRESILRGGGGVGPRVAVWCLRNACWIPRATNTQSVYIIVINLTLQRSCATRLSVSLYIRTLPVLFPK